MKTPDVSRINVQIQGALAAGWLDGHDGRFIFVMCREGVELQVGRRTDDGELVECFALLFERGLSYEQAKARLRKLYEGKGDGQEAIQEAEL